MGSRSGSVNGRKIGGFEPLVVSAIPKVSRSAHERIASVVALCDTVKVAKTTRIQPKSGHPSAAMATPVYEFTA
jgi:hypothetical protein